MQPWPVGQPPLSLFLPSPLPPPKKKSNKQANKQKNTENNPPPSPSGRTHTMGKICLGL